MIRLFTFGGLEVSRSFDDGPPIIQSHLKRNAFLAYLATERPTGSYSRDTLRALFWPESDERHARDALNQLMHSLRNDLGGDIFLKSRGKGVALNHDVVRCDAVDLESAVSRGEYSRALELYVGDFLAGFYLSNAQEFEEWTTRQRSRFRDRAVTAGKFRVEQEEQCGRLDLAIGTIRRVLELVPFDERAFRTLLRLHIAAGEHGQAVAEFEAYAERLNVELDASPSPETVTLLERVRTVALLSRPTHPKGSGPASSNSDLRPTTAP